MIRAVNLTDANAHALMADPRQMVMSAPEIASPTEWENLVIDRASDEVRVGTWKCEPYTDEIVDYEYDEFMYMISGTVELIYSDGTSDSFGPGQAFLLPKGFTGTWKQPETVVKFMAMIR
ncbi:cupin domain-containing protein [Ruegeria sp. Ofav3-42]|uniref:cupin domain-containing protein n=1 Tax=Ruegeria sp. Ofav3-42 TaxID=2917759 RepID=UPI001EF3D8B2|nr:cupin domain-containing protein [Ruegeria sp. Ofav3-42]MCG7521889.1 cupin domain-containing protein [Ruegeria sp. Ofav3-42]